MAATEHGPRRTITWRPDAARSRQSVRVTAVLQHVQIDHIVADLTIVDEDNRLLIGRPYLTIAIDGFPLRARSANNIMALPYAALVESPRNPQAVIFVAESLVSEDL